MKFFKHLKSITIKSNLQEEHFIFQLNLSLEEKLKSINLDILKLSLHRILQSEHSFQQVSNIVPSFKGN